MAKGKEVGIFFGIYQEVCEPTKPRKVKGFRGALFKGFKARSEALDFLSSHGVQVQQQPVQQQQLQQQQLPPPSQLSEEQQRRANEQKQAALERRRAREAQQAAALEAAHQALDLPRARKEDLPPRESEPRP